MVLHHLRLAESLDVELQVWRADCKVIFEFSTMQVVNTPNPHIFQESTILGFASGFWHRTPEILVIS